MLPMSAVLLSEVLLSEILMLAVSLSIGFAVRRPVGVGFMWCHRERSERSGVSVGRAVCRVIGIAVRRGRRPWPLTARLLASCASRRLAF